MIIDKIYKTLKGKQEKSFLSPTIMELTGAEGKLPAPSARNYAPYVESYQDKPWVYACVSAIAESVASLEFALKNHDGQTISSHPVLKLLYKPNGFMNGRELRQWIITSLELTGNAYLLKDSLRSDGSPAELFPLMSHLVEIVPGQNAAEPVAGYKYRAGSKTAYYRAADVIHFKYFNPQDFYYGLSPIAAARRNLDSLECAEIFNRSFFENSATVSGILSTEHRLDDNTRKRIVQSWHEKYSSPSKAHKIALLEGGLKWQNISMSQRDMEFINSIKLSRETVLAVFRVPPAIVGLFESSPQYTTKEQQRIFYQSCVLPKQTLILDTLTEFLLPDFDKTRTMYLDKDISSVSVLKDDEIARAQAAKIYSDMGFTRAEIVEALGLPFGQQKKTQKRSK